MKILIDINHPSQVHLFKCAIWEWKRRGHTVLVVARDKDVTIELLDDYGIQYVRGTTRKAGVISLFLELFIKTVLIFRTGRKFSPDVLISLGSPSAAWAGVLLRTPHLAFTDTEHSIEQLILYAPFSARIYTPECFLRNLGLKQRRYAGYHELAYLHPNRYEANPDALGKIGLAKGEVFFVVRLVSFNATHDVNKRAMTSQTRDGLIELLSRYGKVVVSSEEDKGMHLMGGQQLIPSNLMHDLLAAAELFIGEGTTMATESALLGTPSITLTPHHGGNRLELEERYQLIASPESVDKLFDLVLEMLSDSDLKEKWRSRRDNLLNDKIDVTEFMVEEVEAFVRGLE